MFNFKSMKRTQVGWIIHMFAIAHAMTALTCRAFGVEDELLLTIMTMSMALLICVRKGFNVEFTAASIIMVNILGYLLGNAGARLFSHIMESAYAIHASSTALTTEILGWSIVALSKWLNKVRNTSNPLSLQFLKWIILAMAVIFSIRIGIIFLISSNLFAAGAMMQAATKVFSNSFALITLICINIIFVRNSNRPGDKRLTARSIASLAGFTLLSSLICATLSSIGLSFKPAISSWLEFFQIVIVTTITQIAVYCVIFMVNFSIAASNKMQKEKEKKHVAQYRYQKLKRQVNPHFLFNSLNVLDCLVCDENTELASIYIHKLASVYRYMLKSEEEDFVRLEDELTFVGMYTDLLKVRFQQGFDIKIDVLKEDKARFVLPCSLQLLIENATKHNTIDPENPLIIKVTSDGKQVCVSNNLIPKVTKVQSTGLGQKYIRQQYLDLSDKKIQIEKTDNEYKVTLPLL